MSELEKVARELEAKVNSLQESETELLLALEQVFDFTKNKPIGSNEYRIHMLCYSAIKKATT